MKLPSREKIEALKKKYPAGTTVELIAMDDVQAPPAGTRGEVWGVDDMGDVMVTWQNGSTLSLIPSVDPFRIVKTD
ncbi:MAG: DUF4314 domain-containing protein [Schwartzia sp.]|nr:DUF4314 domain-containing protein [Schwartzia sp. (in: firmicutes)]